MSFRFWRDFSKKAFLVGLITRMTVIMMMTGLSGYHYLAATSSATKTALVTTLVISCIGLIADMVRMFSFTEKSIRESAT